MFTIIFYGGFSERYLWMPRPARPLPRLLTGNILGIVFVIGCKHKNFFLGKHLYCHMQQAFFILSGCIGIYLYLDILFGEKGSCNKL